MILKIRGKENEFWHLFDKVNDLSYKNIGSISSLESLNLNKKIDEKNVIKVIKENSKDETYFLQFIKETEGYDLFLNTYGFVMNNRGETIEKIGQKTEDESSSNDSEMKNRLQKLSGIVENNSNESETDSDPVNNGVNNFRSRKLENIKENIKKVKEESEHANGKDVQDFIDKKTMTPNTKRHTQNPLKDVDDITNFSLKGIEDFFERNNINPADYKREGLFNEFEDELSKEQKRKVNNFYNDKVYENVGEVDSDKENIGNIPKYSEFIDKNQPVDNYGNEKNGKDETNENKDDTKRVEFEDKNEDDKEKCENNNNDDNGKYKDFTEGNMLSSVLDDASKVRERFKRVADIDDEEEAEKVSSKLYEYNEELDQNLQDRRDQKAKKIAETVTKTQKRISKDELKSWVNNKGMRKVKVYPLGEEEVDEVSFENWEELKTWCEENDYNIENLKFSDVTDRVGPATIKTSNTKRVIFGTEPGFGYEESQNNVN